MLLSSSPPRIAKPGILVVALLLIASFLFVPASEARDASQSPENTARNMVLFGDSVVADPPVGDYLARRVERGSSKAEGGRFCPTSEENFGVLAAAELGLPVADYSCAGATSTGANAIFGGQNVTGQIDRAISDGALNPATARVLLSVGFNDTYTNLGLPGDQLRAGFVEAMVPLIDRIRDAAPTARIQLVGYATISDNRHLCLFNAGGSVRTRNYVPAVSYFEDLAQDMQRDLSQAADVEFLDLKPSTADRGMCAPDNLRNWAGIFDVNASPNNLPYHMNFRGHEHVARVIAQS